MIIGIFVAGVVVGAALCVGIARLVSVDLDRQLNALSGPYRPVSQ